MKKSLTRTVIVIGFVIALLGLILDPLISDSGKVMLASILATFAFYVAIAAILGTVFVFAKNDIVANVGFGLCGFVGALGIALIANESNFIVVPVGFTLMFIGALLQFLYYAIVFFGFIKDNGDKSSTTNSVTDALMKYKDLESEKVISEEEFADLKANTIAMFSEKKVSLEDLKKWKKLLDQKVITEEEFADVKAKIFKK